MVSVPLWIWEWLHHKDIRKGLQAPSAPTLPKKAGNSNVLKSTNHSDMGLTEYKRGTWNESENFYVYIYLTVVLPLAQKEK